MKSLTEKEIQKRLESMEGWDYQENAIHATLEFENFKDAFSVMTRIAFEAEKMQHHPEWTNIYNTLSISLYTHDLGGVSEKDFELAAIIDSLVD